MKKRGCIVLAAVVLSFLLALPVCAEEATDGFFDAVGELPDDIKEGLPDGFLSGDGESLSEAVQKTGSFSALLGRLWTYASLGLDGALSLFASLLGVLVLAAVFKAFRETITGEGVRQAVSLVSAAVTLGMLLTAQCQTLSMVEGFFSSLSVLVGSMAPMMATLYAMGGNVQTAAVGHGGMMTLLALLEMAVSGTLRPVVGVCTAFAASSAIAPQVRLSGILNLVKRCYTFFLGALMTVLTFALSMQTTLAAAADNVAMRGAKMLAGNAIPVVGSSVGETLKTVSGSVSFLKGAVGYGSVLLVVFMLLPPLVSVLLHRLAFIAAQTAADVLGLDTEKNLIGSFVTIYGYMLAAMCIVSVAFIFLLTLFVRCRVAVGG